MRLYLIIALLCSPLVLSGCEDDGKYPVSGEECGPNDPVKTLDASDCTPPVGI
jgi:hypothetical protein